MYNAFVQKGRGFFFLCCCIEVYVDKHILIGTKQRNKAFHILRIVHQQCVETNRIHGFGLKDLESDFSTDKNIDLQIFKRVF
jgi:hypothetical protein